jgi:hypothetical protein
MAELSQNIFDYATSELSQDAFISLLIAWFDSHDEELREISKDFIDSLYEKHCQKKLLEFEVIRIKQQRHFKIDVYFEIKDNNGRIIPFIIEDKTWTEPHSDQLKKYVQKVSSKKNKNYAVNDIVKIFLKTGHITEKDKAETDKAGYIRLDTLWIYDFLEKHSPDHAIYKDYKDYLKRNFYDKLYDKRIKRELKDWKYDNLIEGFVQYALIEKIKHLVLSDTKPVERYIEFTRNGKRWDTWWSFEVNTDKKYKLFAKITKLKEGHCIRLLDHSNSLEGKEDRMRKHREIVGDILKPDNYKNIKITRNEGYKVKESAIAIMNLKNISSLEDAAKEFSNFMKEFNAKCRQ